MEITYSDHAEKRRKQRGFTNTEIELVLENPDYKKKRIDGKLEVFGRIRNRNIKVIYVEKENYIRIVSVM
ncbi:DUF4258 domain-containing protein [Candidatus Woesearchaeota archaeon]|nr:DUF4258 domain-containing protein [Candidatus Woesearchaeota archaeon]